MNRFLRKIKLSVLLFVWVFTQTSAQTEIGFKGGYGYGQYFFQENFAEKDIYIEFVPLYNGGIVFQYLNTQKVGIQSSLLYMQKGWTEKSIEGGKAQFLMDFAELEFLTYLKFSRKKENGLFIKFGPYIGYSFNQNFTRSGNIDSVLIDYDSLITGYKKFEYGVAIGLSYTFKIAKSSMQLGFLYRQGMYNILTAEPNGIFQSISQSLFINMAYTIPLSRNKKQKAEAIKED